MDVSKQKLVIIDTGCANLASVRMAFERLGVRPLVSSQAADIEQADKLILPGVGTAVAAMKNLNERGLVPLFAPPSSRCWAFVSACRCWRRPPKRAWVRMTRQRGLSTALA